MMDPMSHQFLMMGIEMVPDTSVIFNLLMRRITREDSLTLAATKDSDFTIGKTHAKE
jgi:hypothetical protein